MTAVPVFVDERQVRRAADRAAGSYAEHAGVEREIGRRMLERLDYVKIDPRWIIDFGSGPDLATPALRERYRDAGIVNLDFSERMLRAAEPEARRLRWMVPQFRSLLGTRNNLQKTVAHAARAPFRSGLAQLAWSNLMLPWCNDPAAVIGEMHRVLEVGGLLMFTTLGPDTLKELRAACPDGGRTQRFIDMHDWGDMLAQAGFADPVVDMEMLRIEYASVDRLFADLRASGATNAMGDRPRGLGGRAYWGEVRGRLEQARVNGKLSVTLEVVYGHAWKGEPRQWPDGRQVVRFARRPA